MANFILLGLGKNHSGRVRNSGERMWWDALWYSVSYCSVAVIWKAQIEMWLRQTDPKRHTQFWCASLCPLISIEVRSSVKSDAKDSKRQWHLWPNQKEYPQAVQSLSVPFHCYEQVNNTRRRWLIVRISGEAHWYAARMVNCTANLTINPCPIRCFCSRQSEWSKSSEERPCRPNKAPRRCAAMTTGAHLNSMEDIFGGGTLEMSSLSAFPSILFISV